jgi:DNA-3-methyladenine glycosylase
MVPTPRSAVMFGPTGRAYVYLIYGMHTCFNVVAHAEDAVGAILIRALHPEEPLPAKSCRGPARLCVALAIERRHNGCSLTAADSPDRTTERLWLSAGAPVADAEVFRGPRIGVEYAGADALLPYRLGLRGHPDLSRPG